MKPNISQKLVLLLLRGPSFGCHSPNDIVEVLSPLGCVASTRLENRGLFPPRFCICHSGGTWLNSLIGVQRSETSRLHSMVACERKSGVQSPLQLCIPALNAGIEGLSPTLAVDRWRSEPSISRLSGLQPKRLY